VGVVVTTVAGIQNPDVAALGIAAGLGAGALIGLLNRIGVAIFRLPSMVWTLAGNPMLVGAVVFFTGGFKPRGVAPELSIDLALGRSLGVPNAFWFWCVVIVLMHGLLRRTVYGQYIMAAGNSEKAVYLSGIRVRLLTMLTFVFAGLFTAVGSLLLVGYANQAYQGMGDPYLMPVLSAVVPGGNLYPWRSRQLCRNRGRRAVHHAADVHPFRPANAQGRSTNHVRADYPWHAAFAARQGKWPLNVQGPVLEMSEGHPMTPPSYEVTQPEFLNMIDTTTLPKAIARGFTWAEGPVWWHGALYFNDIPAKRMLKWHPKAGLSTALENSEFANGNTLDGAGRMISCEHGGRCVIRRPDPESPATVQTIADRYQGKRLN